MTMKETNQAAKNLADEGITSMAKLRRAVPVVVDGIAQMKTLSKLCRETMKSLQQLSDKCSAFAKDNVDKLDGCMLSANGVQSADLAIDDSVYHVAFGFDGYSREDGDDMSQDFLATLPTAWIKVSTALSKSAVNASKPSAEQLQKFGLIQLPKNVWSLKSAADDFDGIE